jgi:LysM repeat protein
MYRRIDGVNLAHDKMKVRVAATNEEALDEISKELAGRYIKKAHYRGGSADFKHGMIHGREMVSRKKSKMDQADAKEFSKTSNKREKGIGLATDKLTGRAKVQANEEVMKESIKAKLLARHMKEDQSFKSAQVIEANAFDLGKTVPDASMKIRGSAYPSVAARIKDMATAAKGIAGTAVRGLAKGFGNPVTAGAMIAAEPTPANSGENEFARQAKYAPKTAPTPAATPKPAASTPAVKASTATPATTKPVAAPTSAPAPKPAAAPASAPAKSSYFKGGSMGDTTVKSGQTLSGIAKSTGQSVADLAKMNNISDVNKISAGAKLMTKVPTPAPRPADVSSASTSAPKPAEPTATSSAPVDRTSSNPPTTSGNPTPVGGGAITQDAQKKQKTTQDAGTSSAPAPVAECVQIGANKYRIV